MLIVTLTVALLAGWLLCSSAGQQNGTLPQTQLDALHALYAANDGDNWIWSPPPAGIPWNFSSSDVSPCVDDWQGVICAENCTTTSSCTVTEISLPMHGLSGTIPSEFGLYLSDLVGFNFYRNTIGGPIPTTLGLLSELTNLIVYRNCMTGTIPTELGLLQKMVYFDLGFNNLNGTIPFLYLPKMTVYYADTNHLTGSIPSAFGTLPEMTLFAVCVNQLSSSIPSELGSISKLSVLNVHRNLLTGTIPSALAALTDLKIFNMAFNLLTGRADAVVLSDSLFYYYMTNNFLTGAFPFDQLCRSSKLLGVLFADNMLTGGMSSCVGNWTQANTLDISQNSMEGTLPSALATMPLLKTLIVAGNYFEGQLGPALAPPTGVAPGLETLDVSDNGFSGSLPFEVFRGPALRTFVGVKNCFGGSLSAAICDAASLESLMLSGLTAGSSCVSRASKALYIDLYLARPFSGSLPECLFSMGNLTQLAASGNSIHSTLHDIPTNSRLVNISLSNNRLHGTIPTSVQQRWQLRMLDLSFNRLSGTIEQMDNYSFSTAQRPLNSSEAIDLRLESNRLSGLLPRAFKASKTSMTVLAGNTFQCPSRSDLPSADAFKEKYVCGSDEFDAFSFTCLSCVFVTLATAVAMVYFFDEKQRRQEEHGPLEQQQQQRRQHQKEQELEQMENSWYGGHVRTRTTSSGGSVGSEESMSKWRRSSLSQMLVVSAAVKAAVKESSSLRLLQKLLLWSDADTSGHPVTDALARSLARYRYCCFIITAAVLFVALPCYLALKMSPAGTETDGYSTHTFQYGWFVSSAYMQGNGPAAAVFALWLCTLGFVVLYDKTYVEHVVGDAKGRQISIAAMGGTKRLQFFAFVLANTILVLVVNGVYVYTILSQPQVVQGVVSFLMVCFKLIYNTSVIIPVMDALGCKFAVIMCIMAFNNNLAPILATMAVNISCFESLFVGVLQLSSTYTVSHCSLLFTGTTTTEGSGTAGVTCDLFDTVTNTIDFSPPFIYSNQCASELMVTYVPVYLATYGIVGVLVPALQFALLLFFRDMDGPLPAKEESESAGTGPTKFQQRYGLPTRLQLLRALKKRIHHYSRLSNRALCAMVLPLNSVGDLQTTGRDAIYHSRQLALNWSCAFIILVTFGVACPVLAVVVMLHLTLSSLTMQLCINRHGEQAEKLGCVTRWVAVVRHEVADVHKIIFGSRAVILLFSCVFAMLFIFDMTFYRAPALLAGLSVALVVLVFGGQKLTRYVDDTMWPASRVSGSSAPPGGWGEATQEGCSSSNVELQQMATTEGRKGSAGATVDVINPIKQVVDSSHRSRNGKSSSNMIDRNNSI